GIPATPPIVRTLKIEGELHFREGKVRRRLRIREGRPRNRPALNDGVDRLLRLYQRRGFLTADVDVHETAVPGGRIDMLVHVRSGPRVRIEVEGARGKGALREEIRPYWEKGLFLED